MRLVSGESELGCLALAIYRRRRTNQARDIGAFVRATSIWRVKWPDGLLPRPLHLFCWRPFRRIDLPFMEVCAIKRAALEGAALERSSRWRGGYERGCPSS